MRLQSPTCHNTFSATNLSRQQLILPLYLAEYLQSGDSGKAPQLVEVNLTKNINNMFDF